MPGQWLLIRATPAPLIFKQKKRSTFGFIREEHSKLMYGITGLTAANWSLGICERTCAGPIFAKFQFPIAFN